MQESIHIELVPAPDPSNVCDGCIAQHHGDLCNALPNCDSAVGDPLIFIPVIKEAV